MDRRLVIGLAIAFIAVIAGFAVLYHGGPGALRQNATSQNSSLYEADTLVDQPVGDVYLNFLNGTPSRIFLISSHATFGTFTEDHIDPIMPPYDHIEANKGDRFVSIVGTLRSDYDRPYWIFVDARVYDKEGNRIGELLRSSSRPEFKQAYLSIGSNGTGQFGLTFKFDKQYTARDIGGYEIIVGEPMTMPPP